MMKRIVKSLFFLCLLLIATGLIGPSLIDWNQHKAEVVSRLSVYFQRKIDIAGNISLQVIPQPELMLENVTVETIDGANSGALMTLKQLGMRIKLAPLFEGRVEVESLDLVEPVINLEVLAEGRTGWTGVLKEKSASALGSASGAVQLNSVNVSKGTLIYSHQASGTQIKLEDMNLSIVANTLRGPYTVTGQIKYKDVPLKVSVSSEIYNGLSPVPIKVSFAPKMDFDGTLDMQAGLALQGDLTVSEGKLGGLIKMDGMNDLPLMQVPVNLQGVLSLKGDELNLSGMKIKFPQKGEASGSFAVKMAEAGKPILRVDLEAKNLTISDKPEDVYIAVPAGYTGTVHVKGKNVTWAGQKLPAGEITAEIDGDKWQIKSATASLAGGAQLKMAGTALPSSDSGHFTVQLTTEDMGKTAASLSPAANNILRFFSNSDLFKKLSLNSSLDISPARISLFNLDAQVGEKMKLSGVLNLDRIAQRPNVVARLNFTDWDGAAFAPEAVAKFKENLLQSDADVELEFKNYAQHGFKAAEMGLRGKVNPAGVDLTYNAKIDTMGNEKLFDLPLPAAWHSADVQGTIKGGTGQYSFTATGKADGRDVNLSGTEDAGGYQVNVSVEGTSLGIAGFPVERLIGHDSSALKFSGMIKGTAENYKIENIKAEGASSVITGLVEKKDNQWTSSLVLKDLNLDQWLSGIWDVPSNTKLNLETDKVVWQGHSFAGGQIKAAATSSSINIPSLSASAWGGQVLADLSFTRQNEKQWSSAMKGTLTKGDINAFTGGLGLSGVTLGVGDVSFNLLSLNNTAAATTGDMEIKSASIKFDKLNFENLGEKINQLTTLPATLPQMVSDSLYKSGAAEYKNATVKLKLDKGKMVIEKITVSNDFGSADMTGFSDSKKKTYQISGKLQLKQPQGVPAIVFQCTSEAVDCSVDVEELKKYIIKINPAPVAVQPDVAPVPAPVEALPPESAPLENAADKEAIKGILERLDEGTAPPAEPVLKPTPPPDAEKLP